MKCNNCGKENEAGAVFCIECGTNLNTVQTQGYNAGTNTTTNTTSNPAAPVLHHYQSRPPQPERQPYTHSGLYSPTPTPAPVPAYQPVYTTPVYGVPVNTAPLGNGGEGGLRIISHLKQLAKSPAMLVATIAFTLSAFFYILTVLGLTGIFDTIGRYGSYDDAAISATVNTVVLIVGFLAFIPILLKTIGMWITVSQGFSTENKISTVGTTLIKGVSIFEFVMFCINLTITSVSFISGGFFDSFSYMPDEAIAVFVISILIYIGSVVWTFFYYPMLFKTIDSFRDTVLFRAPVGEPSTFVAVNSFLSSAGSVISLVVVFFYNSYMNYYISDMSRYVFGAFIDAWNFLMFSVCAMIICSIIAAISFGVMTVTYKNRHSYMRFER